MKIKIKIKDDAGKHKEPDADDAPKQVMKKAAKVLNKVAAKRMRK